MPRARGASSHYRRSVSTGSSAFADDDVGRVPGAAQHEVMRCRPGTVETAGRATGRLLMRQYARVGGLDPLSGGPGSAAHRSAALRAAPRPGHGADLCCGRSADHCSRNQCTTHRCHAPRTRGIQSLPTSGSTGSSAFADDDIERVPGAAQHEVMRCRPGTVGNAGRSCAPDAVQRGAMRRRSGAVPQRAQATSSLVKSRQSGLNSSMSLSFHARRQRLRVCSRARASSIDEYCSR